MPLALPVLCGVALAGRRFWARGAAWAGLAQGSMRAPPLTGPEAVRARIVHLHRLRLTVGAPADVGFDLTRR